MTTRKKVKKKVFKTKAWAVISYSGKLMKVLDDEKQAKQLMESTRRLGLALRLLMVI